MDLSQTKLTRAEWNSIEIPTEKKELDIIKLICKGYHNVNISDNKTLSLLQYLKIRPTKVIHEYIYCTYLQKRVEELNKKYEFDYKKISFKNNKMKKADIIRFSNTDKQLENNKHNIFEFIIFDLLENMLKQYSLCKMMWQYYYYTIHMIMKYNIIDKNSVFVITVNNIMARFEEKISITELIKISDKLIEKNDNILKYSDITLYDHQKELFTYCKNPGPKLITYIAPTGTGKTLSPLGLSENHKIIFVCAARHVGLALANAAISIEKKVAFAFGCQTADDIRLHYFSAKDYMRNRKSGSISKVDNLVGDKVEIMICDIKSYLVAMHYMLAFNDRENIILYWDEPTISMDYKEHEIHQFIHNNWIENDIPNVVLSSATLPNQHEMIDTIRDFRSKFDGADIHNISSFDCKKTIPLINKLGYVEVPHYLCETYDEVCDMSKYCEENKTLMRYIDLQEIVKFIVYINKNKYFTNDNLKVKRYFHSIDTITMASIKEYYIKLLLNLKKDKWETIKGQLQFSRVQFHKSNIYVVTKDSHTLTDGPTIFLADDVNKIAELCIRTANIPDRVEKDIMDVIMFNDTLNKKISVLQRDVEDKMKKDDEKDKKAATDKIDPSVKKSMNKIVELQNTVKTVELNSIFVPNTREHIERFCKKVTGKEFTCSITEEVVEKIMLINDVDIKWKLLLLMGIGVFSTYKSVEYMEIMKSLAKEQNLFMIIASSDFIYGTNYQFCHSYISKDLGMMSQEKCVQAMGRVGRRNTQKNYTIRFRDDTLIKKLFIKDENKPEVINMKRLLCNS